LLKKILKINVLYTFLQRCTINGVTARNLLLDVSQYFVQWKNKVAWMGILTHHILLNLI